MRQTGSHSISISDGGDPTNVWSSDFRLHGWLDDLYGAAAVSVFDPEDREPWQLRADELIYVICPFERAFFWGILWGICTYVYVYANIIYIYTYYTSFS